MRALGRKLHHGEDENSAGSLRVSLVTRDATQFSGDDHIMTFQVPNNVAFGTSPHVFFPWPMDEHYENIFEKAF